MNSWPVDTVAAVLVGASRSSIFFEILDGAGAHDRGGRFGVCKPGAHAPHFRQADLGENE